MPDLVFFLLVFLVVGVFFLFIHLLMGKFIRPSKPEEDKLTIYECGEPTVGSAWIQFDLRYYVVALLFVIFDVEVAFFFPWAVVFGNANTLAQKNLPNEKRVAITQSLTPQSIKPAIGQAPTAGNPIEPATAHRWAVVAFFDILVFFGVLMVGFAYLWKRGDINWVRSTIAEDAMEPPAEPLPVIERPGTLVQSS